MFILSKKKDYYDGVAGTLGIDKTIVYERKTIELDYKQTFDIFRRADYYVKNSDKSPFLKLGSFFMKRTKPQKYQNYSYFIVGFCGKIYVGWKLYEENNNRFDIFNRIKTTITYDFEFIKTLIDCERSYIGNLVDVYNEVINYDVTPYFQEVKSPIFLYDSGYNKGNPTMIVNPILADYEFYKIFDSFLAFQEIQMYIGGVLGNPEKDTLFIEDKYKIAQYGFDKWSFRKEPQK